MVLENKIDRFISKIEMGKSFFEDAAAMLVQMIDEEPGICERIVDSRRVNWLTQDVLHTFEAIGRKQLAVEAMFLPKHILNRMLSLPVEEQARLTAEPVRVINGAKRRDTDGVSEKHVAELTRREAAIVFGPKGIRSVEEQAVVKESLTTDHDRIVGCYELTVMNGKAFLKKCECSERAQKIKLDHRGQAIVKVTCPF